LKSVDKQMSAQTVAIWRDPAALDRIAFPRRAGENFLVSER
jgi:hypothetical protein